MTQFIIKLSVRGDYPAPGDLEEYEVSGKVFDEVRALMKKRKQKMTNKGIRCSGDMHSWNCDCGTMGGSDRSWD